MSHAPGWTDHAEFDGQVAIHDGASSAGGRGPVTEMLAEREEYREALLDYTRRTIVSAQIQRMHEEEQRQRWRDQHEHTVAAHVRAAEIRKQDRAVDVARKTQERFNRVERNRRMLMKEKEAKLADKVAAEEYKRQLWEQEDRAVRLDRMRNQQRTAQQAREAYVTAQALARERSDRARQQILHHETRAQEQQREREERQRLRNERRLRSDIPCRLICLSLQRFVSRICADSGHLDSLTSSLLLYSSLTTGRIKSGRTPSLA